MIVKNETFTVDNLFFAFQFHGRMLKLKRLQAQFTPPTFSSVCFCFFFVKCTRIHRNERCLALDDSLKEKGTEKNSFPSAIAIEVYCNRCEKHFTLFSAGYATSWVSFSFFGATSISIYVNSSAFCFTFRKKILFMISVLFFYRSSRCCKNFKWNFFSLRSVKSLSVRQSGKGIGLWKCDLHGKNVEWVAWELVEVCASFWGC